MVSKVLLNSLLVTPALLGVALFAGSSAIAAETPAVSESADSLTKSFEVEATVKAESAPSVAALAPMGAELPEISAPATELAQVPVEQPATQTNTPGVSSLDQVIQYSNESNNSMPQVTSITQLSDVLPTDWAYQALQSLVERYGCIAGYPDGTYRGNRAMTRYEFAAGMNACLDRISEILGIDPGGVTPEDLATIQRLQEEFAAELATLRGRVDALEARVSEVEANQFSTTTKLRGEVIFALSAAFEEDDGLFDDQAIFADRVRLNFDTSFTGEDRLRTRLQARNVPTFEGDPIGFSFGGDDDNDVVIDDLYYSFPIGNRISAIIGANGLAVDEIVASTISPLDSSGQGSISDFGLPRQYIQGDAGSGAGAGVIVQFTDNLSLDFGYVGDEPNINEPEGNGIFNGDYTAIGQLTFLSDFVDAAVTFTHGYDDSGYGFDDNDGVANTYGGQVNFKLGDTFEIGGGIAYTDVSGIGAAADYEVWSYQGTLAINDLGGEGNQLGVLAGVPPYTRDLDTEDTGFLAEVYYRYRLNDNISLTPSVIWISDPFNNNEIDDTIIGTLRTTFTF
jgi:hypothetical protein